MSSSSSSDDDPEVESATTESPASRAAIKEKPCEEKASGSASLKILLSPLVMKQEDGSKLSADQLKKHRRNERDRRRSFAKRVRVGAG
ncbi:unnamed protein product [Phytophthora fragariaefolia]|uniref:Unnamed protein product n=1 Tax=Phytophthora fragariaefolia TaxID=1490495 RepID=A0A9W6X548_9STRA|nr:unnamed protein product [Phytophthora fragariaefolia]